MIYNFDEIIDRKNTNCVKWDRAKEGVLPMWVADMDFRAAEPITQAIQSTVDKGIFGYTLHSQAYYDAIINWWERKHDWQLEKQWILFCQGVVPSLAYTIEALTEPGDKIILQSPVYYPFYRVITNKGCEVVNNPLNLSDGKYEMDFQAFEKLASDPKVKLLLLCNPQNPGGRVWTIEELTRLGDICVANNVIVVSDEIHCDIVFKGYKHIPFGSIKPEFSMNSVTCTAPSKTFNLAGLQVSNLIIPNKELRTKVKRCFDINEVAEPNVFCVDALVAAYDKGEEWLNQMLEYVQSNLDYLLSFFEKQLPMLKVMKPEATYLVWVDCRAVGISSKDFTTLLTNEGKVWFNDGRVFGENGEGYIRINLACPRVYVVEGLNRLKGEVDKILEK